MFPRVLKHQLRPKRQSQALACSASQSLFSTGGYGHSRAYSDEPSPYAAWDPVAKTRNQPSAPSTERHRQVRHDEYREPPTGFERRSRHAPRPLFDKDDDDSSYSRIFSTKETRRTTRESMGRSQQPSPSRGMRDGGAREQDMKPRSHHGEVYAEGKTSRPQSGNASRTQSGGADDADRPRRKPWKWMKPVPFTPTEADVNLRPLQRHEIVDVAMMSRDFQHRVRMVHQIKNGHPAVREDIFDIIVAESAVVAMATHPQSHRLILALFKVLNLSDLVTLCASFQDNVLEMATDTYGRIVLEQAFERLPDGERDAIVNKLLSSPEDILTCIMDPIGSFVVQAIMRKGHRQELNLLFEVLKGKAVMLSQYSTGSGFCLSLALETLPKEDGLTLMKELVASPETTMEVARNQHGCHTLCDLLVNQNRVPGKIRGSILKAMKGHIVELACLKSGSKVLWDALESMRFPAQRDAFLDELLSTAPDMLCNLCIDTNASVHIQWALENGNDIHRDKISNALQGNMDTIMAHRDGVSVLRKVILSTSKEKWSLLGAEVAASPIEKLIEYSKDESATFVIQRLIEKGTKENRSAIRNAMMGNMIELSTHKTAHFVVRSALSCLKKEYVIELIAELLESEANVKKCAKNHFGTFVLQRVFDAGTPEQCAFLKAVLTDLVAEREQKEAEKLRREQGVKEAAQEARLAAKPRVDQGVDAIDEEYEDQYKYGDEDQQIMRSDAYDSREAEYENRGHRGEEGGGRGSGDERRGGRQDRQRYAWD